MDQNWKQFTLYPNGCRNRFAPNQVFFVFLPSFVSFTEPKRWHCLFEPSALVRFISDNPEEALDFARKLAPKCGLIFEDGDISRDLNPNLQWPEVDYHGEEDFYGESLWEANTKFMQACSELSMEICKLEPEKQVFMLKKFLHLYGNAMGMNYLEEATLCRKWAARAEELFDKYGRT